MQLAFYFDSGRCLNCYACEIACKAQNNIAPGVNEEPGNTGPRWRRVITIDPVGSSNLPAQYISLSCMHCGKPACLEVCPTKAISKRPDGIVLVDSKKCIGCHYCFFACPFGVPQYGADGTMQKCTMCVERLEQGKKPACVESCCGGAIQQGTLEELSAKAQKKIAARLAGSSQPSLIITR